MNEIVGVKKIAILGAGPSGLFLYKRLIESGHSALEISIFERKQQLGAGMPYSSEGANVEHITNVSDNEIPEIVISVEDWVKIAPRAILDRFNITPENFNEFKVLPRLFFGAYLAAQFEMLLEKAEKIGIVTKLYLNSSVVDIRDEPDHKQVAITIAEGGLLKFDKVVVCTGHNWPSKYEGKVQGYFDSPYPPTKLNLKLNHPVGIKGSSLTAIDAIRTLSRNNGTFYEDDNGNIAYQPAMGSENFRLVMHSKNGMLPAVRFHLEDSHLNNDSLLTEKEMIRHRANHDGFLSLDYLFEKDFKEIFRNKQPEFYQKIKDLNIEGFVALMMQLREDLPPFQLLRAEYQEAEKSIKRRESVYWKEMLAVLSFALNYPAKYLSAEDAVRLQRSLMPLISIVIAFIPQGSCRELLALHQAGLIDLVAVGEDSEIKPADIGAVYHYTTENNENRSVHFETFIDCVGQPHLPYEEFPFKSLLTDKTISRARLKFESPEKAEEFMASGNKDVEKADNGDYYLRVPGIAINDNYQLVDDYGAFNDRIYMMAVPYIGGFNPDYSGLDFCAAASKKIVNSM